MHYANAFLFVLSDTGMCVTIQALLCSCTLWETLMLYTNTELKSSQGFR